MLELEDWLVKNESEGKTRSVNLKVPRFKLTALLLCDAYTLVFRIILHKETLHLSIYTFVVQRILSSLYNLIRIGNPNLLKLDQMI